MVVCGSCDTYLPSLLFKVGGVLQFSDVTSEFSNPYFLNHWFIFFYLCTDVYTILPRGAIGSESLGVYDLFRIGGFSSRETKAFGMVSLTLAL